MPGVVLRGAIGAYDIDPGVVRTVLRDGQGAGLAITGEAGIGKSALLSAAVREASHEGAVCGMAQAERGTHAADAAISQAVAYLKGELASR
jgi:DNA replication protein DnaC